MCFNQNWVISFRGKPLKLVDQFIHLGSNILSSESDVNICIGKTWTSIDRLLTIWKSDLSDKIKMQFFQAVVVSVLLYGCTTLTLTKRLEEKKLDGTTQGYLMLFWTIPGSSTPQNSSCNCSPLKPSKKDEQDMLGSAWEAQTKS